MTLRARREVGVLRKEVVLRAIVARLKRASGIAFRVVHWSVQPDHMHLIVEAAGTHALARKMTGLNTWLARAVNRILGRQGPFFADRYHRHDLRSPREVRNALLYVLQNRTKHEIQRVGRVPNGLDPCSSAPWSDDVFAPEAASAVARARRDAERMLGGLCTGEPLVARAETWLATRGWLRARGGRLGLREIPAS